MFCPQYGKQIPDTSKVCGFCGSQIQVVAPPPPPVTPPHTPPPPPVEESSPPAGEKIDPEPAPAAEVQAAPVPEMHVAESAREKSPKDEKPEKPRDKVAKKTKEKKVRQPRPKKEKKVREKPARKPRENPLPWKWILPGAGALLLVFLVLVYLGLVPLPGLRHSLSLYLPSPNAIPTHNTQFCVVDYDQYPTISSSSLTYGVRIDGRPSTVYEWADATCMRSTLRVPVSDGERVQGTPISVKWWVKNDAKWIYILVQVPVKYGEPGGVYFNHFWPGPYVDGWDHSDGAGLSLEGEVYDMYGWDEISWKDDEDQGGRNDTVGAVYQDGNYYWFELKKPLDSGEALDWSWTPGTNTGIYNSTLLGVYGLVDNYAGHQLNPVLTFAK